MSEQENNTCPTSEETYEVVFRNGALNNLKTIARDLSIPETDLKQVINKSINLLTLVKSGKFLVLEDDKGNRFKLDLNRL